MCGPGDTVEPFNESLLGVTEERKIQWAQHALVDLTYSFTDAVYPDTVWFLCGKQFREYLVPLLRAEGVVCYEPLARMSIGKQLQWLGGTMEIDLKELERELQAMTDDEAAMEMQKIQRIRMSQAGTGSKERQKSERELLKALKQQIKEDPGLRERLLAGGLE